MVQALRQAELPIKQAEDVVRAFTQFYSDVALTYQDTSATRRKMLKSLQNPNSLMATAMAAEPDAESKTSYTAHPKMDKTLRQRVQAYQDWLDGKAPKV